MATADPGFVTESEAPAALACVTNAALAARMASERVVLRNLVDVDFIVTPDVCVDYAANACIPALRVGGFAPIYVCLLPLTCCLPPKTGRKLCAVTSHTERIPISFARRVQREPGDANSAIGVPIIKFF